MLGPAGLGLRPEALSLNGVSRKRACNVQCTKSRLLNDALDSFIRKNEITCLER